MTPALALLVGVVCFLLVASPALWMLWWNREWVGR